MKPTTMTVRDTAQRLGYTTKYVFDLLYNGRFKGARKVDGKWAIPLTAVEQHRSSQRTTRRPHRVRG